MSLKHALLGFLSAEPMTGYDLHKHFKQSANHFWAADQSQIYRTLADLESSGLVASTLEPQAGKPDRRIYHLLAQGKQEFETWLNSPLTDDVTREPFLLRVFFADSLGKRGVLALIEERRAMVQGVLQEFEQLNEELAPLVEAHRASLRVTLTTFTLRNGQLHYLAESQWLDELTALITKEVHE